MIAKPWFPASATTAAPAWIFPIPMGQKQSTPAAREPCHRSFDVLYLFPQFFDLRFHFKADAGNFQGFALDARSFRKHGVSFAVHLLKEEIQFLAELASSIQQFPELQQMATQAV